MLAQLLGILGAVTGGQRMLQHLMLQLALLVIALLLALISLGFLLAALYLALAAGVGAPFAAFLVAILTALLAAILLLLAQRRRGAGWGEGQPGAEAVLSLFAGLEKRPVELLVAALIAGLVAERYLRRP